MAPNTRMTSEGSKAPAAVGGSGTGPLIEEVIRFAGNLSARRTSGADQLQMLAQSARGMGETFDDLPAVRDQLDMVAERIDEWAEYIRSTDMRDMASDARKFVYEHPYATFAVAIVGGLAIGGYVKRRSSASGKGRGGRTVQRRRGAGAGRGTAARGGGMAREQGAGPRANVG